MVGGNEICDWGTNTLFPIAHHDEPVVLSNMTAEFGSQAIQAFSLFSSHFVSYVENRYDILNHCGPVEYQLTDGYQFLQL